MSNSKWLNLVYMTVFMGLGIWAITERDWLGVGIDFGAVGMLGFLAWWRFLRKPVTVTVTLDKDPVPKGEFFTYSEIPKWEPLPKPTAPPGRFRNGPAYQTWLEQHKEEYPDCALCPLPIDEP